ncbi:MAG: hypothetical protein ACJA08_003176 [Cyclobacteriaceae bacterium]|jgi:hypothetical protein
MENSFKTSHDDIWLFFMIDDLVTRTKKNINQNTNLIIIWQIYQKQIMQNQWIMMIH